MNSRGRDRYDGQLQWPGKRKIEPVAGVSFMLVKLACSDSPASATAIWMIPIAFPAASRAQTAVEELFAGYLFSPKSLARLRAYSQAVFVSSRL